MMKFDEVSIYDQIGTFVTPSASESVALGMQAYAAPVYTTGAEITSQENHVEALNSPDCVNKYILIGRKIPQMGLSSPSSIQSRTSEVQLERGNENCYSRRRIQMQNIMSDVFLDSCDTLLYASSYRLTRPARRGCWEKLPA